MGYTRRAMLAGLGLAGLETAMLPLIKKAAASSPTRSFAAAAGLCPFRLAVINDEITQDFEKACQIVSGDFGLHWMELRSMWDKNVTVLNAKEVEDAKKILDQTKLGVTEIGSPQLKQDGRGPPGHRRRKTRTTCRAASM